MKSMPEIPKLWLEREFALRRSKNPQYSLRAFAKFLAIPPGRLSQLFSEKRELTPQLGRHLATRLGYAPDRASEFLSLIAKRRATKKIKRKLAPLAEVSFSAQQLDMDKFCSISEPIHYDILSLLETDDFRSDPRWIGKRLGHSPVEVRAALSRLRRLRLIEIKNNKFVQSYESGLTTSHDISSTALRAAHRQVLRKAEASLDDAHVLLRDITSMTMAVDLKKVPAAKALIRKFRRELAQFLEDGEKQEVYRLNVQLVPVTRVENKMIQKLETLEREI